MRNLSRSEQQQDSQNTNVVHGIVTTRHCSCKALLASRMGSTSDRYPVLEDIVDITVRWMPPFNCYSRCIVGAGTASIRHPFLALGLIASSAAVFYFEITSEIFLRPDNEQHRRCDKA